MNDNFASTSLFCPTSDLYAPWHDFSVLYSIGICPKQTALREAAHVLLAAIIQHSNSYPTTSTPNFFMASQARSIHRVYDRKLPARLSLYKCLSPNRHLLNRWHLEKIPYIVIKVQENNLASGLFANSYTGIFEASNAGCCDSRTHVTQKWYSRTLNGLLDFLTYLLN